MHPGSGVLLFWTAGCATMRGMGEDIQSLGRGIKKVFSEEPPAISAQSTGIDSGLMADGRALTASSPHRALIE